MAASGVTATWITCSIFSVKGSRRSSRKMLSSKKEGICLSKNSVGVIRAQVQLEPPPYPMNALEPHMSRETLDFHWGKHHRAYVDNLNKQIGGTELDGLPLEHIILATYNKGDLLPAFNNAAQAWNHDFFWKSMKPGGGGKPTGELLELINRDFGSFEKLVEELKAAATSQFGSGWAWLAYKANKLDVGNAINPRPSEDDKKLVVVKTPNAVNPLVWDYSPLLTIDVWEHAYYLDYQNRRPNYVSVFFDNLVSWEAVSSRLQEAKERAAEREKQEDAGGEEEVGAEAVYVDNDADGSDAE